MKYLLAVTAVIALCAADDQVEIGWDEFPANEPFCADCALSMRYQVLYLESEIGGAMEISSFSMMSTPSTGSSVFLDTLVIYMGNCDETSLGTDYEANYREGSRIKVLWQENCTVLAPQAGEWFDIELDQPFWYDGQGGLIIEFAWPDGYDHVYNYNWSTTTERSLHGGWGAATGFTTADVPRILLKGALSLEGMTFGGIKACFGM